MKNLPKVIFCSDKAKAQYKQAVLRDWELQAPKLIVINKWPPEENIGYAAIKLKFVMNLYLLVQS